jgi:hypothetical protein
MQTQSLGRPSGIILRMAAKLQSTPVEQETNFQPGGINPGEIRCADTGGIFHRVNGTVDYVICNGSW